MYDLYDRGVLAEGMKADVNLIDLEALEMLPAVMVFDLPLDGRRILQKVKGYTATVCSGVVTHKNGEATGELPGRLIRGPQRV